ncbi:MAG: hypothetical protein JW904_00260 [Spirochaetales bacterium]|nr:hypothetical protein [Spirochaetales bacterium]
MKRILILALVFVMALAGNSFADGKTGWAIGGAYTFDWMSGNNTSISGAALLLKFPQIPVMWGVSARFTEPSTAIGVTADWWLFQAQLVGPVSIYIGPGLYFWMITTDVSDNLGFGMRIPVGFQIFIMPAFEIFLEPALTIGFLPVLPDFGLQAAIGFRFWF